MSTTSATYKYRTKSAGPRGDGWLSRLGAWSATHLRVVLIGWLVAVAAFGAFAPQVESVLSGAGWQDSGSQSIAASDLIAKDFAGLGSTALQVVVHDSNGSVTSDPAAQRVIARVSASLKADHRISTVVAPQPGLSISRDGRTAIVQAGAAVDANEMVRAADDLIGPLRKLSTESVTVQVTGSSALWANFNKVNHAAMIKSEVLSWPVTLVVLVLAFGSLVAAGLPLMLTLAGLVTAAGALVLATHVAPVSIWAMNFAMMFALALGIDYALFIVVRFRAALHARADEADPVARSIAAVAETMGTAGKAVAFSGVTVLVSLSTVLLVPSPAFRGVALGIMLSVVAVLAASLTLLPAVLGRLGTRIDAGRVRLSRSRVHAPNSPSGLERMLDQWGAVLQRRPWLAGGLVLVILGFLAWPVTALRTGMPSISIIPASQSARAGYNQVVDAFGPGAPGTLSVLTPAAETPAALTTLGEDHGIAAALSDGTSQGWSLTLAIPTTDASAKATGATVDRLRRELPTGSLVGGAAAENHDLEKVLSARTALVFGLLIGLGFLLLLVALGSPLVAFVGVATNLASIAAAFGVAKWIFQDGHLAGALNFEPQGFVDAWGPLFFGAMLSGVAMDYTLFLLSAAREHYDLTGDPEHAMQMALRTSGRVVLAAAGVMVAVFLTFALSGPLAPKEMGIILAVAVFLDSLLIRLILLPVVLRITGHAAWHRLAWLDKVLPNVNFATEPEIRIGRPAPFVAGSSHAYRDRHAGMRVEASGAESIVRFESRTVIQRPVRAVFERLADLPGYRGWMHRTGMFRGSSLTSEVPVRRGTTYVDSTRMGTFDGEVVEFVPPTRIAFRETLRWFGSPLTQARPEYSLEGDESATVVHHVAVGELYGWMRIMKPAAAWMANRERSRTLNSLKRSLESD